MAMIIRLLDASVPFTGAVMFWLFYFEKLKMRNDLEENKLFFKKNKKILLFFAVAFTIVFFNVIF